MADAALLLRCRRIRKAFPGVVALDGVGLEVAAGTVHALVGENGAGKSTLIRILSGALGADEGVIEIDGEGVEITDVRAAQRYGIGVVHQELNLVPDLSVSENIFLGRWPRSRWTGLVDFKSLDRRASRLLGSLGISLPVGESAGALTVARQQVVDIAHALSLDARILILDEPSAVLTPHELGTLFALLRDLKRRGVGIIYISHRLDEVFELADRVTVLRDGKVISSRPIEQVSRNSMIAEMVGRDLGDEFPRRGASLGDRVLDVAGLSLEGRFCEVTFAVRAGEVFGLTGLVGSGRSSVLKAIFGAVGASSGALRVADVRGPFESPRQAMSAGVACLVEDRKREGLLLGRNVRENITLTSLSTFSACGLLSRTRERVATRRLMDDLRIKATGTEAPVTTLSGGNQQKVLLARWMGRAHRVMLLDEPTRGVDVGAKVELYKLINRLAEEGAAVVLVSSELPEVIGMADRIGVMHEGRMTGILDNDRGQVTQEQIMVLASGER